MCGVWGKGNEGESVIVKGDQFQSPNSESRDPKEIRNPKSEMLYRQLREAFRSEWQ
jgi:hypothetical protein